METTNQIKLRLPNTLAFIAGNDLGKKIYFEQIEPIYKDKVGERFTIVFPSTVEGISISFVQGLFSEILKKIEVEKLLETIEIKASSQYLVDKIRRDIIF